METIKGLSTHESPSRQWFALTGYGVVCLGDCGDFEAADEIACDLGLETNWLVSPEEAKEMADMFATKGITGAQE